MTFYRNLLLVQNNRTFNTLMITKTNTTLCEWRAMKWKSLNQSVKLANFQKFDKAMPFGQRTLEPLKSVKIVRRSTFGMVSFIFVVIQPCACLDRGRRAFSHSQELNSRKVVNRFSGFCHRDKGTIELQCERSLQHDRLPSKRYS